MEVRDDAVCSNVSSLGTARYEINNNYLNNRSQIDKFVLYGQECGMRKEHRRN